MSTEWNGQADARLNSDHCFPAILFTLHLPSTRKEEPDLLDRSVCNGCRDVTWWQLEVGHCPCFQAKQHAHIGAVRSNVISGYWQPLCFELRHWRSPLLLFGRSPEISRGPSNTKRIGRKRIIADLEKSPFSKGDPAPRRVHVRQLSNLLTKTI